MILFIDDEERYVENICDELKFLGKEVEFCDGVDKALSILAVSRNLEVIVCDVMMPHGDSFSAEETDENARTGLLFVRRIRANGIKVPVVLLTNDEREHVREQASKFLKCNVVLKKHSLSFEIAEQIVETINRG
jgi:CheY-like chemotaxis protein